MLMRDVTYIYIDVVVFDFKYLIALDVKKKYMIHNPEMATKVSVNVKCGKIKLRKIFAIKYGLYKNVRLYLISIIPSL